MLTTGQKATILARAGDAVPAFPARSLPIQERHLLKGDEAPQEELDADAQQAAAVARWSQQIEDMYVIHVAARAARSLREAQEAIQLDRLRRANAHPAANNWRTAADLRCAFTASDQRRGCWCRFAVGYRALTSGEVPREVASRRCGQGMEVSGSMTRCNTPISKHSLRTYKNHSLRGNAGAGIADAAAV